MDKEQDQRLEFASTDELLDELERRHEGVVCALMRSSKNKQDQQELLAYYSGEKMGFEDLLAMASYLFLDIHAGLLGVRGEVLEDDGEA